jgi:hypothetical protein
MTNFKSKSKKKHCHTTCKPKLFVNGKHQPSPVFSVPEFAQVDALPGADIQMTF